MRRLLYFLFLLGAVACTKDATLAVEPVFKKLEWHVHAAENYTGPWLDSMQANVQVRIYKIDTLNRTSTTLWDTTFLSRPIRQYPILPAKHVIEKQVPVLPHEKLQAWYNIRYEMNGSASEMVHLEIVQAPFTFIDINL